MYQLSGVRVLSALWPGDVVAGAVYAVVDAGFAAAANGVRTVRVGACLRFQAPNRRDPFTLRVLCQGSTKVRQSFYIGSTGVLQGHHHWLRF